MIDTSNAKWDFSKEEKFAIKWFEENGYNGKIIKQYISKTIFEISKDGITDKFELPQGIVFKNIKGYMEQYRQNWNLLCKLHRLREEIEKRRTFAIISHPDAVKRRNRKLNREV